MTPVVVLSGSPSPASKTARLADFVVGRLKGDGLPAMHIQIRDLPAEALVGGDAAHPMIAAALAAVEAAEGVVFATPTYKAAYSGLLKLFIDLLPQFGLTGKAALPLATGGSLAHVMALDYALRPVLHSLGARHIVQGHFTLESDFVTHSVEVVGHGRQRDMLLDAVAQFEMAIFAYRAYARSCANA